MGGKTGVGRAYPEVMTKFSRIDRLTFSIAMNASPRARRLRRNKLTQEAMQVLIKRRITRGLGFAQR